MKAEKGDEYQRMKGKREERKKKKQGQQTKVSYF